MSTIIKKKTAYFLALLLAVSVIFSSGLYMPSFFAMDAHAALAYTPYSALTRTIKSGNTYTFDTVFPYQSILLEYEAAADAKYTLKVTSSSNNLTYTIEGDGKTKTGTNPSLTTSKLKKGDDVTFEVYYTDLSVWYDTCKIKLSKDSSSSSGSSSSSSSSKSSSSSSSSKSSSSSSSSKSSGSSGSSSGSGSSAAKGSTYRSHKANFTVTGTSTVRYDGAQMPSKATVAEVPATVKLGSKTYNVTAIGSNAFAGYNNLHRVVVGENVSNIRPGAFSDANSLTTINIHSTKLTMSSTKDALKNSHVKRVLVPITSLTSYKKIFSKTHSGSTNSIQVRRNNYSASGSQTAPAAEQPADEAQSADAEQPASAEADNTEASSASE